MAMRLRRWAVERHLSAADERFGLRLGAGFLVTPVATVAFVLLLVLVRAGWPPLRNLDAEHRGGASTRSAPIIPNW